MQFHERRIEILKVVIIVWATITPTVFLVLVEILVSKKAEIRLNPKTLIKVILP